MRPLLIAFLSLFVVVIPLSKAQTRADEEAVRKLPEAFSDAWAKHEGHELAKMMAGDVDFVTGATTYLPGQSDFEEFHVRLPSGRFKDSTITPLETTMSSCVRIWPLSIGVGRLWAIKCRWNAAPTALRHDDLGRGKAGRQLARRRSEHQRHSRYTARTARHKDSDGHPRHRPGAAMIGPG